MFNIVDLIKSIILGIVEGITEWLPISSTGHMILFNDFMNVGDGFLNSQIYIYVIQLGAILAIATLYFRKLNPFALSKTKNEKKDTWQMWFKVLIACLPAAIIGLLFNDTMERISNSYVVITMLIIYGVAFLFIENNNRIAKITNISETTYKTAILIGIFQVLSIVPGTSRSGATILGAMILGCSREISAEFSFFLAIPVMFGVSFLKITDFILDNNVMLFGDFLLLITGMVVAYIVSLISVKFLVNYVKQHDFKFFGYYRIALGIIVLIYMLIK